MLSVAVAAGLATASAAPAQDFDGITVLDITEDAANALRGKGGIPGMSAGQLVTFVAAAGTYASVVSSRGCVAWAVDGSYTGQSITFGLPASTATQQSGGPPVCQPFTLTVVDEGTVRIEATGSLFDWTGRPLSSGAAPVSYNDAAKIVARVPLVRFDWGLPVFERHEVDGVILKPIERTNQALEDRAEITIVSKPARAAARTRSAAISPAGRTWRGPGTCWSRSASTRRSIR